jgi:hypothetical protein
VNQVPNLTGVVWRKASYSNTQGGNCVEVADLPDGMAVRDSKDPSGPMLQFTLAEWQAFVAGIKDGEFDR